MMCSPRIFAIYEAEAVIETFLLPYLSAIS